MVNNASYMKSSDTRRRPSSSDCKSEGHCDDDERFHCTRQLILLWRVESVRSCRSLDSDYLNADIHHHSASAIQDVGEWRVTAPVDYWSSSSYHTQVLSLAVSTIALQGSFVPDRPAIAALPSQTLRHGVICVLPVVVNYSSLDTISPHMVVGLFLSRVRLPGTVYVMNCVNRC